MCAVQSSVTSYAEKNPNIVAFQTVYYFTWILRTGEQFQAECMSARGGPDRTFTPAEILAKVDEITAPVYANLSAVCRDLVDLDDNLGDPAWTDTVARMTQAARRAP